MINNELKRAVLASQIEQYEIEQYRLEIQQKIATNLRDIQAQRKIEADLTTIRTALEIFSEEMAKL